MEIAPRDASRVTLMQAESMVPALWSDLGLLYPPAVAALPRQSRRTMAHATRVCLCLPAELPSWCLMHEMAHALSSTADGVSDGHGPVFVGLYVMLLERYLRLDRTAMTASLARFSIAVAADARPIFLAA